MKKKKILVVDDEVDFLEILKKRLTVNNYDVVTASSGEDALNKFKKENPNAILLDIMLPGMDGLGVLKKIREENKTLPIFILTAFSNEERVKSANKFNATGYIVKGGDLQGEIDNITKTLEIADKYKT